MQYTLRNIPRHLDERLRRKAREENKSLNEVAIAGLMQAFGLTGTPLDHRDLADISGTWVNDQAVEEALDNQRQIDAELWN
ncbi:MAG: hypothetical protein ACR2RL_26890 [Gammaproteobacteria bacterium]